MRIGTIFHLSKAWIAKFFILWCYIFGEAAGKIWNWSVLGVKGLKRSHCRVHSWAEVPALILVTFQLARNRIQHSPPPPPPKKKKNNNNNNNNKQTNKKLSIHISMVLTALESSYTLFCYTVSRKSVQYKLTPEWRRCRRQNRPHPWSSRKDRWPLKSNRRQAVSGSCAEQHYICSDWQANLYRHRTRLWSNSVFWSQKIQSHGPRIVSVPHLPIAEEIAIKWYSQLQPSFYTTF